VKDAAKGNVPIFRELKFWIHKDHRRIFLLDPNPPLHPQCLLLNLLMASESFGFQAEISQLLDLIISM